MLCKNRTRIMTIELAVHPIENDRNATPSFTNFLFVSLLSNIILTFCSFFSCLNPSNLPNFSTSHFYLYRIRNTPDNSSRAPMIRAGLMGCRAYPISP